MTLVARCAVLLALAAAGPAHAQGDAPPAEAERRPLAFAAPPAGWRARPAEEKPYAHDFDLPSAAGGEAARVNVLFYPLGFDDYRAKLLGRWQRADGAPLTAADQAVDQADLGDLRLRWLDQAGTYTPRDGPARPGWRLVAVHVRAPNGKWSAWLLGPAAEVQAHREAYLAWVRSARQVDREGDVRGPACLPACPPGEAPPPPAPPLDVRAVHGAPPHGTPSPWALLGERIGRDALARLGAAREDGWQVVVTLRAPAAALPALDGLLVATGASPGKGNLRHAGGDGPVEVTVEHRPSQRVLTYRVADEVAARLRAVASAEFPAAAQELAGRPASALFGVSEVRPEPAR